MLPPPCSIGNFRQPHIRSASCNSCVEGGFISFLACLEMHQRQEGIDHSQERSYIESVSFREGESPYWRYPAECREPATRASGGYRSKSEANGYSPDGRNEALYEHAQFSFTHHCKQGHALQRCPLHRCRRFRTLVDQADRGLRALRSPGHGSELLLLPDLSCRTLAQI